MVPPKSKPRTSITRTELNVIIKEVREDNNPDSWVHEMSQLPQQRQVVLRSGDQFTTNPVEPANSFVDRSYKWAAIAQAVGSNPRAEHLVCERCTDDKGRFVGCVVVPKPGVSDSTSQEYFMNGGCANCWYQRKRCSLARGGKKRGKKGARVVSGASDVVTKDEDGDEEDEGDGNGEEIDENVMKKEKDEGEGDWDKNVIKKEKNEGKGKEIDKTVTKKEEEES